MIITEFAKEKIVERNSYLVILIKLGGCRKYIYYLFFRNSIDDLLLLNDFVLTNEESYYIVDKLTLDYRSEIGYEDFVVISDFDKCGCGKSFDLG